MYLPCDLLGVEIKLWISNEEPKEALLSTDFFPLEYSS